MNGRLAMGLALALALTMPTGAGAKKSRGDAPSSDSTGETGGGSRKLKDLGPSEMIPPPTPLSKILIVDQQRVHMIEAGWNNPEVLIVLPGFPEPAVACQKLLDPLSKRFHVMIVDPQGFGFSGGPNWVTYSPQGMAQYVLRLMDYLQIDKAHIAGFDLSGATAIRFAYDYPDRVHSIVVGAGPVFPERYTGLIADAQVPITGDRVISGLRSQLRKYLAGGIYDQTRYDDDVADELYAYFDNKDVKARLHDWINSTGTDLFKMESLIEQIELPVFVVWGEDDPYFDPAQAEELAREFPDARYKIVAEAGHFLLLEQPIDVSRAMVEHVYEPPPPAPPFSGLSFTAYRGQTSHRYFLLKNNREKDVTVSCSFDGTWRAHDGGELLSSNVTIDPAEDITIEAGDSFEVSVGVSMADRDIAVETIYSGQILCEAQEGRTDVPVMPLPIRLQIPQLGDDLPAGFEAKALGQQYEVDVGTPKMEELIKIQ